MLYARNHKRMTLTRCAAARHIMARRVMRGGAASHRLLLDCVWKQNGIK